MTKTIRNVTIVVPVLMTSCQLSDQSKSGPVAPHTTTLKNASAKCNGATELMLRPARKPVEDHALWAHSHRDQWGQEPPAGCHPTSGYIRPITRRMMMITTNRPKPPLG